MASPASTVQHLAPAKVNLALHVTGQRKDGYHLLDTLVIFTDFGDFVDLTVSEAAQATISGPFSVGLVMNEDNLVCRAERMWRDAVGVDFPPVHLHLTKNLPVASGIGGGSAD
ncbi:MAG: 4-(cytidine 5'-diphospho)-2-C-methyl-D-erythritol kinase, partial [Pseudomonadota bacterium]